jgi:hypothetical protein
MHELNTFSQMWSSINSISESTASIIGADHIQRCDMCGNVCLLVIALAAPVRCDHHPSYSVSCSFAVIASSCSLQRNTRDFGQSALSSTRSYCMSEMPLIASEARSTLVLMRRCMQRIRKHRRILSSVCLYRVDRLRRLRELCNSASSAFGAGAYGSSATGANS